MGPLHGFRIIDMTSVLMGPFASQTLGDMGADVVKIEPPEGDLVRQIGPARHSGMGPIFLNTNRNKRSVVLDLKQTAGVAALKRLLAEADVLMTNVRPQAMARLGLDVASVRALNPRLVYASLLGFGQAGPYAARPAYDDLIQGASALPHLIARAGGGEPRYVPTAMADRIVGQTAFGAIVAALLARERDGQGEHIEIPMFETMVAFNLGDHLGGLSYVPPLDGGGYARHLSPERRPYATLDGHVCALVYTDKQWRAFLGATGRAAVMADDPRFASFEARMQHIDAVYGLLAQWFTERSTADWLALLTQADVPCMPMHDLVSVLDDPHLLAVDFFETVQHPSEGTLRSMRPPVRFATHVPGPARLAPRLGEHTAEVLAEAGFSAEARAELLVPAPLATGTAAGAPAHASE